MRFASLIAWEVAPTVGGPAEAHSALVAAKRPFFGHGAEGRIPSAAWLHRAASPGWVEDATP